VEEGDGGRGQRRSDDPLKRARTYGGIGCARARGAEWGNGFAFGEGGGRGREEEGEGGGMSGT